MCGAEKQDYIKITRNKTLLNVISELKIFFFIYYRSTIFCIIPTPNFRHKEDGISNKSFACISILKIFIKIKNINRNILKIIFRAYD